MHILKALASGLFRGAVAAAVFCAVAAGQTPASLSCDLTNGAVTPTMRAEGLAERIGDIVLVCTGGTPTASGSPLPQVNITVTLNTNVTSRILDATGASEAILTVDEPGSQLLGASETQLACATPLTGCSITSNGGEPYDGTPGHPNMFEGVVSGSNSVTFYGVPLTAPGSFGIGAGGGGENSRPLRITNIRSDTASLWNAVTVSAATAVVPVVEATVSIASSPAIPVISTPSAFESSYGSFNPAPGALIVGFPEFGLLYQTWNAGNTAAAGPPSLSACVAGSPCLAAFLHFSDNFSTAFMTRIAANITQQNIPGAVYDSESGLFNTTLATSNPNFATIGLADAGTRLKAAFEGVPVGAQLWVGLNTSSSNSISAALTANEAGPLSPVAMGATIGGLSAAQLTVTNGSATAVWEVTSTNLNSLETFEFPVWIIFPSGSTPAGNLTIQGSFAPNADSGAFPLAGEGMAQTAAYPEPRFTSGQPPNLGIGEVHEGNLTQGETGASFTITVGNAGSATFGPVAVEDMLPSGILTVTSISGSGWSCTLATLVCMRTDILPQGESYPPIFLTANVPGNAPAQFLNQLTVSGGGSNTASAEVAFSIGSQALPALTSIGPNQAALNSPAFTLTANGTGFQSGASILWVTPAGALVSLATGHVSSAELQASVPASLLTTPGTAQVSILNTDYGVSGQQTFSITTLSAPQLSISSWHSGNFSQGEIGATYTVTVANQSGAPATNGTVVVTDAVPAGLNMVSMSGSGWACDANVCIRSDALSGGAAYPPIILTVNVAANAGTPLVNSVSVSGGGAANAGAADSTAILTASTPVSAVSVSPAAGSGPSPTFTLHYSDYTGGAAALSTVWAWFTSGSNTGGAAYSCMAYYSPASNELYLENDAGTGTLDPILLGGGGVLSNSQCSLNVRGASVVSSGANLTLTLPVTFTAAFAGTKYIYLYAASSAANSGWQDLGAWTVPGPQQVLTVSSTHRGVFTQGQDGALYSITISNTGTGPTLGQVTLAETLTTGLSLVSMSGAGWTCAAGSCYRSDELAVGASYPAITVTADVAANASSPQTNSSTVSGGGSALSTATDATIIVPPTTISLTSTPNPSEFGKTVTITATVSPSSATGLVTFYDGVTALGAGRLSGGQAVLNTILLASGSRSLHAHYIGDGAHGASNSATTAQNVTAIPGAGFMPPVSYNSPLNFGVVATGDFNGDGKADLAIAFEGSENGYLRILLGNGDGTFTVAGDYNATFPITSIAAGDFNGDGKTDVAVSGKYFPGIALFAGNGDGTFQTPIYASSFLGLNQIIAADYNGDGKLDLAGLDYGGTGVWVFLGNGDGTFQAPVHYENTEYPNSLAVADFNGDGIPDLVIPSSLDGSVVVLLGIGDGTFAVGVEYAAGGQAACCYPASVTTGDFNGDGKPDIAVATLGLVALLLGNGDGTFQPAVTYTGTANPSAIAAADFNGDGFLDLAVTDSVAGTVSVFRGGGNGSLIEPAAATNSGGATPSFLIAGEFNGDGITDLAVLNYGSTSTSSGNNVSVLLGSAALAYPCAVSSFTFIVPVNGGAAVNTCLLAVPGGTTVAASAFSAGWLSVQPASFTNPSTLTITAAPGSLAAGTYLGSITLQGSNGATQNIAATLDVVTSSPILSASAAQAGNFTQGQAGAKYIVTVSNQAGVSETSGLVTVTETVPSGLILVSMAGDGWTCNGSTCTRSDVLESGFSYPAIAVIVNAAAGAASPQTNSITASGGGSVTSSFSLPTAILSPATVSLTSGTNPSVYGQPVTLTATVTPSAVTGSVTFYEGTTVLGSGVLSSGVAALSTILLPAGNGTLRAYYAGDGSHGPGASNPVAQSVNANAGGAFTAGTPFPGTSPYAVAVGDFNGDGKADMAVIENGGGLDIALGNGLGNFVKGRSYLPGVTLLAVAVGDFNGDGKADLALSNFDGNSVCILLGNGDGTFQLPVTVPVGTYPMSLVVGDFNGDGKADLAVLTDESALSILLGNGDGTFQTTEAYAVDAVEFLTLAVGDFNGDGKTDLVIAGNSGFVMLGRGDGTFEPPLYFALEGLAVAVADFNGDGKADLAISSEGSGVNILLGNGDGTFNAAVGYAAGLSLSLAVADFNGDGIPDVAAPNSSGGVSLLLGNGDGAFQPATVYAFPGAQSLAIGDFNGDGRTDIALPTAYAGPGVALLLGALPPALSIASTHGAGFSQGQSGAAYTVTVSNQGPLATVGAVTVTETLPTGLGLISMSGAGWTCAANACSRSDALATGSSYPAIGVTVNVAGSTSSPQVNSVTASGGGSTAASAIDPTSIFSACDLKQTGGIGVADVQLIINEALGAAPAVYDLSGTGVVNVVDVQIEINAALGLGCAAK